MSSTTLINPYDLPGMAEAVVSTEKAIAWGSIHQQMYQAGVILSSTVDATNTPTTQLRAGLLVGQITATGKFTVWDETATNGSQIVAGVLAEPVNMLDFTSGSAADKRGQIMISGPVKAGQLIGLNNKAREQMSARGFLFDDSFNGFPYVLNVVAKTANYTVTTAENGTLFTNAGAAGAVTFTLPTVAKGLRYQFFAEADQTVTVAGATGTLVVFNDAAANSIAFSTASEKIGGGCEVIANAAGTKWLVKIFNWLVDDAAGQIATIAT